jgi:hypothetical protein
VKHPQIEGKEEAEQTIYLPVDVIEEIYRQEGQGITGIGPVFGCIMHLLICLTLERVPEFSAEKRPPANQNGETG